MNQPTTRTSLKVAAVQQACSADKTASLETSERLIRRAAAEGAELIVLQELHATLYFCQTEDVDVFKGGRPFDSGPQVEIYDSGIRIVE